MATLQVAPQLPVRRSLSDRSSRSSSRQVMPFRSSKHGKDSILVDTWITTFKEPDPLPMAVKQDGADVPSRSPSDAEFAKPHVDLRFSRQATDRSAQPDPPDAPPSAADDHAAADRATLLRKFTVHATSSRRLRGLADAGLMLLALLPTVLLRLIRTAMGLLGVTEHRWRGVSMVIPLTLEDRTQLLLTSRNLVAGALGRRPEPPRRGPLPPAQQLLLDTHAILAAAASTAATFSLPFEGLAEAALQNRLASYLRAVAAADSVCPQDCLKAMRKLARKTLTSLCAAAPPQPTCPSSPPSPTASIVLGALRSSPSASSSAAFITRPKKRAVAKAFMAACLLEQGRSQPETLIQLVARLPDGGGDLVETMSLVPLAPGAEYLRLLAAAAEEPGRFADQLEAAEEYGRLRPSDAKRDPALQGLAINARVHGVGVVRYEAMQQTPGATDPGGGGGGGGGGFAAAAALPATLPGQSPDGAAATNGTSSPPPSRRRQGLQELSGEEEEEGDEGGGPAEEGGSRRRRRRQQGRGEEVEDVREVGSGVGEDEAGAEYGRAVGGRGGAAAAAVAEAAITSALSNGAPSSLPTAWADRAGGGGGVMARVNGGVPAQGQQQEEEEEEEEAGVGEGHAGGAGGGGLRERVRSEGGGSVSSEGGGDDTEELLRRVRKQHPSSSQPDLTDPRLTTIATTSKKAALLMATASAVRRKAAAATAAVTAAAAAVVNANGHIATPATPTATTPYLDRSPNHPHPQPQPQPHPQPQPQQQQQQHLRAKPPSFTAASGPSTRIPLYPTSALDVVKLLYACPRSGAFAVHGRRPRGAGLARLQAAYAACHALPAAAQAALLGRLGCDNLEALRREVEMRRELCVAQALPVVIASLRLMCGSPACLRAASRTGSFLHIQQSLLSDLHPGERGLLEDTQGALEVLADRLTVRFVEGSEKVLPLSVSGSSTLTVSLPADSVSAAAASEAGLSRKAFCGGRYGLTALLFNQGINSLQSLGFLTWGWRGAGEPLQDTLNRQSLERLNEYAVRAGASGGPALAALNAHYGPRGRRAPKDTAMFGLVLRACSEVGGGRAVNCKSGKDRTALEVSKALAGEVVAAGLLPEGQRAWLEGQFLRGLSYVTTSQNHGQPPAYAFNEMEIATLPHGWRLDWRLCGKVST